jgi:hypothetical protein
MSVVLPGCPTVEASTAPSAAASSTAMPGVRRLNVDVKASPSSSPVQVDGWPAKLSCRPPSINAWADSTALMMGRM